MKDATHLFLLNLSRLADFLDGTFQPEKWAKKNGQKKYLPWKNGSCLVVWLFVCLFVCLFGWLVGWLVGWLFGWLVVCLFGLVEKVGKVEHLFVFFSEFLSQFRWNWNFWMKLLASDIFERKTSSVRIESG